MQLTENEIKYLCINARDVFMSQPILLELEAPIKICGDIHGQYYDLLRLFEYGGFPPEANYVFLGDYVDRGKHSLETICLLLALKVQFPTRVFLVRCDLRVSLARRFPDSLVAAYHTAWVKHRPSHWPSVAAWHRGGRP